MGKLTLQITQTRDASFYPNNSLEKGMRLERALQATVAEMYLNSVSTRKVKAITEQLCGQISSTQVFRMTKE